MLGKRKSTPDNKDQLPEIPTEVELYITRVKLNSAENTLHTFMWVAGAFFAVITVSIGWYNYQNIESIKENLDNYRQVLSKQMEASQQQDKVVTDFNVTRMNDATVLMKERLSYSMGQVDQALKQAGLRSGEPKIEIFYWTQDLEGITVPGLNPEGLRIRNSGNGTSTRITVDFYYSGFALLKNRDDEFHSPSENPDYTGRYTFRELPPLDPGQNVLLRLPKIENVQTGKFKCAVVVFYGAEKPEIATFYCSNK